MGEWRWGSCCRWLVMSRRCVLCLWGEASCELWESWEIKARDGLVGIGVVSFSILWNKTNEINTRRFI